MPTRTLRPQRRLRAGLVAALLPALALLVACGDGPSPTKDGSSDGSSDGSRMIEHAYGSTKVPDDPKKVVALGWTDVENAIAVGVTPVIAKDWFGAGLNPWAAELADGEPANAEKGEAGLDYDAILAAAPDLIFANDGMTKEQYERLSKIAPTVGPIEAGDPETGSYGVPWDKAIERTGEVLGREDEAAKVADQTRAAITTVKKEHPEFADLTAAMGFPPGKGVEAALATRKDPRYQVLLELGFKESEGAASLNGDKDSQPYVSNERLGLFEADILFLYFYEEATRTEALDIPLFARLKVVEEGRVVWMPDDIANALTFGTALSIQYVAEKIPPLVAALPLS